MEWSEEETVVLEEAFNRGDGFTGRVIDVASRAVELKAARGGTMDAEGVAVALERFDTGTASIADAGRIRRHIAAQGSRNAVLEADVSRWQENVETVKGERDSERCLRAAIRRRSLEAGNLERLIAEHGLPAAMRWVVDGGSETLAAGLAVYDAAHIDLKEAEAMEQGDLVVRYPCSPTCTHDDAATPGHPERVKERSEALNTHLDQMAVEEARDQGAEAMRAACLQAVLRVCEVEGLGEHMTDHFRSVVVGATP